jgi:hypothetical protein
MAGNFRRSFSGLGTKFISRDPGSLVGVAVNTSAIGKMRGRVTGRNILPILMKAVKKYALPQAKEEWPIETGASHDSIRVIAVEVSENRASAGLTVGGQQLIDDSRNERHIDYAPFIEFNGSPAGRGEGTITNAMFGNQDAILEDVREGTGMLVVGLSDGGDVSE